jgi:hypothetical protein
LREIKMIEFLSIIIGIVFVCYFTYKLIKRLHGKKEVSWKSFWQWVKDIFDSITGIG